MDLKPFQGELAERQYSLVPAEALLSSEERLQVARNLYGEMNLGRDLESVSTTRWRAVDSLYYTRQGDSVNLTPAPGDPYLFTIHYDRNIKQNTTRNTATGRIYKRLHSLYTPSLRKLILSVLDLVPPDLRQDDGQLDIHTQSTFGQVVESAHKDGSETAPVEWIVAYTVSRQGGGAESILSEDAEQQHIVARVKIAPGQALMHWDERYFHDVTHLERSADCPQPRRDVVIVALRPKL